MATIFLGDRPILRIDGRNIMHATGSPAQTIRAEGTVQPPARVPAPSAAELNTLEADAAKLMNGTWNSAPHLNSDLGLRVHTLVRYVRELSAPTPEHDPA